MGEQRPLTTTNEVQASLETFSRTGTYTFVAYETSWETLKDKLDLLGLSDDKPKTIVFGFFHNDFYGEKKFPERVEITEPRSVADIVESFATNYCGLADDPNDFTAGVIFELDDKTWLALRYQSEECELVPEEGDEEDENSEPVYDYDLKFELALCPPGTEIYWDGYYLAPTN